MAGNEGVSLRGAQAGVGAEQCRKRHVRIEPYWEEQYAILNSLVDERTDFMLHPVGVQSISGEEDQPCGTGVQALVKPGHAIVARVDLPTIPPGVNASRLQLLSNGLDAGFVDRSVAAKHSRMVRHVALPVWHLYILSMGLGGHCRSAV